MSAEPVEDRAIEKRREAMIVFDHLKLVRRDVREVKKFRDLLLSAQPGAV
jgi:hypothetical protein